MMFLEKWGSLIVACLAVIVSVRAYWLSRRAIKITETEHGWRREDREREQAEREDETAWLAWCRERQEEIAHGRIGYVVPDDKREWALRGDGEFFSAVRTGTQIVLYPRGTGQPRKRDPARDARRRRKPW